MVSQIEPSPSIDDKRVKKALKALLSHIAKLQSDKTENAKQEKLYLQISMNVLMTTYRKFKPKRISLRHSIRQLEGDESLDCCLIVKDPSQLIKDIVSSNKNLSDHITKVIGLSSLKGKYKSYDAKRQLRDSYEIFLADERIIPLLPKYLGSVFYEKAKSKIPLPIQLEKPRSISKSQKLENILKSQPKKQIGTDTSVRCGPEKLERELKKVLSSVHVKLSPGAVTSIPFGHSKMTCEQLVDNLHDIINALVGNTGEVVCDSPDTNFKSNGLVPKGWDGIRGLYIKTNTSAALPIYLKQVETPVEEKEDTKDSKTTTGTRKRKTPTMSNDKGLKNKRLTK